MINKSQVKNGRPSATNRIQLSQTFKQGTGHRTVITQLQKYPADKKIGVNITNYSAIYFNYSLLHKKKYKVQDYISDSKFCLTANTHAVFVIILANGH